MHHGLAASWLGRCFWLAAFAWPWCATAADEPISFRAEIASLLQRHCVGCHGPEKSEGGYRLDTYRRALGEGDTGREISVGDASDSELIRRLITDDTEERMPLEAEPLAAEAIAKLRMWIDEGAKFDGEDPDASLSSLQSTRRYEPAPEIYAAPPPIAALAFSPDGQQLVVGGYHEVTVWNISDGKLVRRIGNIGERVQALAWTPDGTRLLVGSGEPGEYGDCRVIAWASGEIQQALAVSSEIVQAVAVDPAGERVAVARGDGILAVYRLSDGGLTSRWTSHSDWVTAVAWSSDGTQVLSGSRDRSAKLYEASTGKLQVSFNGHDQALTAVALLDGAQAITCAADGAQKWRLSDGEPDKKFRLVGGARQLWWSGDRLYALGMDRIVRQVDPQSGRELHRFDVRTASAEVLSAAVTRDGSRLAVGGFDGRVLVLDLAGGEHVMNLVAAPIANQP